MRNRIPYTMRVKDYALKTVGFDEFMARIREAKEAKNPTEEQLKLLKEIQNSPSYNDLFGPERIRP